MFFKESTEESVESSGNMYDTTHERVSRYYLLYSVSQTYFVVILNRITDFVPATYVEILTLITKK